MGKERIKVIMTKVGLDGHDRGAKVVASLLKEAGMEVVYLGLYQSPEGIVKAALDEDADVIGVSYLSGEHLVYTPRIVEEMKRNGLDDVLLIAGGSFPPEDIPEKAKAAETIKRLLSNLATITSGIAELRNSYGTGHGKILPPQSMGTPGPNGGSSTFQFVTRMFRSVK